MPPDAMNDNLSEQNKDPLKVDRSERIQLVKVANERERDKRSKCSVPRPIVDLRRDADSQQRSDRRTDRRTCGFARCIIPEFRRVTNSITVKLLTG